MGDVGLHNPNNTASHSEANELQQAVISAHKIAKSFSRSLSLILSLSGSLQHTLIMALHTNEYLKSSIGAFKLAQCLKKKLLPVTSTLVQLFSPRGFNSSNPARILKHVLHKLRIEHVRTASRLQYQTAVQSLFDFRVSVAERFNSVRLRFEQATGRVQIKQMSQNASLC